MKKSLLILSALCLGIVLAFTACNGEKAEKAKLVYWTMWNEAEPQGMVIAEAVAAFTKETGITVEVNFNGREILLMNMRQRLIPLPEAKRTTPL